MKRLADIISEYKHKLNHELDDEKAKVLRKEITDIFMDILNKNTDRRREVVSQYVNFMMDTSGCRVDYEQVEEIFKSLVESKTLCEWEIDKNVDSPLYGRWS
ncbi:hypothetical protein [Vibrio intestinalis]|uniref:hypothetical protein n=1 Tax=Vibrio intestinalis TaxID=2933291 RepID=UPI0021A3D10C|nr:hypothetical protein [Vibrio intestinalis]